MVMKGMTTTRVSIGDEFGGYEEQGRTRRAAVCPLDYEEAGLIIDDESESIDLMYADIPAYVFLYPPPRPGNRLINTATR